jgi:hypothetical protein
MSPDASDLLPPRLALPASGMSVPSYQTLFQRKLLTGEFFGHIGKRGRRMLTHRGMLALSAYRVLTAHRVEIGELPPAAFLRWAELWMRTRDSAKPVHELWVRFYGRPGEPDYRVSILPNADLLSEQPAPGALLSIKLDLAEIFGRTERALAALAAEDRETWEGPDGAE